MQLDEEREVEGLFTREVERRLWSYPGKWVAVAGDEIVAVEDTLEKVVRKAREAGHPQPLVRKVPIPGTSYFF